MSWADRQDKLGKRRGADGAPAGKQKDQPEARLQRAVYATLQMWADQYNNPNLKWVYHVPNGGHRTGAGRFMLSAEGVLPGVPDLVYPFAGAQEGYTGAYQELKSATGTLRQSQREFLAFARKNGAACNVSNTLLGALSFWRWYFGVNISDQVMENQAQTLASGVPVGEIQLPPRLWEPDTSR